MSVFDELNRRRVYRVAAAYLVVGWLLTEVLTTLLPEIGAADWVSRAVIFVFALGLLPAIAFSWSYDITPEGLRRERRTAPGQEPVQVPATTGDRLAMGAAFFLVLGIGTFGAWWSSTPSQRVTADVSDTSVAVLPFENMSADADNVYFSDGLTETILHMLTQVPDLQVAARTSSFAFRDRDMTISEIAKALGVAHVLEGSVQRAGDQLRVTAQLIRAEDGFHIWSRNYDLTIDDIFAVQDEIARNVGGELSQTLLRGGGMLDVSTTNPDAYDLYLQALRSRATFSYGGLREAETLLKAALTIDPDYVDAKLELALNYWRQLETGAMEQEPAMAEITAMTDQVIAERPYDSTARALAILANAREGLRTGGAGAILDAVIQLERLVEIDPDALEAKIILTRFYQGLDRREDAVALMESALEKDPYNPAILYELGSHYAALEQWDKARAALARSLEIEPAQPNAYSILAVAGLLNGDGAEYLRQSMRAIEVDPYDHELPGVIAELLYRLGLVEQGDDFRKRVMAIAPNSEMAYRLELLRAMSADDVDAGLASARRAIVDDVSNRRSAFAGAVSYLLRTAIRQGRVAEELAWLDTQVPGLLDITVAAAPRKYREAQGAAFDAWYVSLPRDELMDRLDALLAVYREIGIEPMDDPGSAVAIHALRGDYEAAVEVALEGFFTQPVAMHLDWRERFAQAQYAPMLEDERIAAALDRWEREEAELRDEIRQWLDDLSEAAGTAEP